MVSYFKNIRQTTGGVNVQLLELYKAIKSGKWQDQVDLIRKGEGDKKNIPYFTVSGTFDRRKEDGLIKHSGRICLDLDKLECPEDTRDQISQLPYCEFAAISVSGTGVFAVCRIKPDEHKEAFTWLSRYVKQALGIEVDSLPDVSRPRFISYDPDAIIQEWATTFEMPQEAKYREERKNFNVDPIGIAKRMIANAVDGEKHKTLLRASRLLGGYVAGGNDINEQEAFNALLDSIKGKEGVDSLTQAEKTINDGLRFGMQDPIKAPPTVEVAERISESQIEPKKADDNFSDRWEYDTAKKYKQAFLEDYLAEFFNFRYNEVTACVEFKKQDAKKWERLLDRHTHSILRDLRLMGYGFVSKQILDETVDSNFSKRFNPFEEYFNNLPEWKGQGHIKELAATITLQDEKEREWFEEMLKRWLVGCVGCSLFVDHINENMLILLGGQGDGKSRWLKKLVPPALNDYQDKGKTKLDTTDADISLSECFLVLFDELVSMRKNDIEAVKALTSTTQLRVRRSYARRFEVLMRRANFCGADNNFDIINDPTGARRFLVFPISNADFLHKINMDLVWSEAKARFDKGEKYWLDKEEVKLINETNERYQIKSTEEELVAKYFKDCKDGQDFYTATDVVRYINQEENHEQKGLSLPTGGVSARKIGSVLTKFFEKKKKKVNGRAISGYLCTPSFKRGYEDEQGGKPLESELPSNNDPLPF